MKIGSSTWRNDQGWCCVNVQLYKVTNVLHVLHVMYVYTYMRNLKIYFVDQEREERECERVVRVCNVPSSSEGSMLL